MLHAEFVVPDGHGGYTTKLTQTGTVDEVTPIVGRRHGATTDTPRSMHFRRVPPTSSVQANDTVTVDATRTGPTVTLNRIGDEPARGN